MFLILVALCLFWIVCSIVVQLFSSVYLFVNKSCFFPVASEIIFSWRFFAPTPFKTDFIVLHSTVEAKDGRYIYSNDWNLFNMVLESHYYHFIFNPTTRLRKAMITLRNDILDISKKHNVSNVCQSAHAHAFFKYMSQEDMEFKRLSDWRRFAIVDIKNARSNPDGDLLFVTEPIYVGHP